MTIWTRPACLTQVFSIFWLLLGYDCTGMAVLWGTHIPSKKQQKHIYFSLYLNIDRTLEHFENKHRKPADGNISTFSMISGQLTFLLGVPFIKVVASGWLMSATVHFFFIPIFTSKALSCCLFLDQWLRLLRTCWALQYFRMEWKVSNVNENWYPDVNE